MLHSLLQRQIKKCGLTEENQPTVENWKGFLARVSRSYGESDQEKYLLERSLTISSQEMREIYEQLRKSETRYALAAQGANDGLWDWDLVTEDIYYSPRWMEILGFRPLQNKIPTRECWLDRIHPNDYLEVIRELRNVLKISYNNVKITILRTMSNKL